MRSELLLCLPIMGMLHAAIPAPGADPLNASNNTDTCGFTLLDPRQTGLAFTNALSPQRAASNQILLNGSGVAAGDVDGDGNCDLYFCSLFGENKLYRNLGEWRFADVTSSAGVACAGQLSTGAAFADVDGDGDLDLLLNGVGAGTRLFVNDGGGRFSERKESGFERTGGSTSLAIADIDADGDLDVYVANYRSTTIRSTGFPTLNVNGRRVLPPEYRERLEITADGRILENGEPDVLYLNDGTGTFMAQRWNQGRFRDENGAPLRSAPLDWGLCAMFYDLNGDLAPDLYVCNDFHSPDRFWFNDGKGEFRAAPMTTTRNFPTFSMAMDVADVNRDGKPDFFVADMLETSPHVRLSQTSGLEQSVAGEFARPAQVERNTLQLGRDDGTFEDVAQFADVQATGWTWCSVFLDVDLDGFEDLLIARGNLFNTQDQDGNERIERGGPYSRDKIPGKLLMYPAHAQTKLALRNEGGRRFVDVSNKWGFNHLGIANGMCLADLDNDGDLDIVVNHLNDAAGVYRNESTASRVAVRLHGCQKNSRGIGARISLLGGAVPVQTQQMISGGRYLSADDAMRVFAARSTDPMRLEVTWRSGKQTILDGVRPNRTYTVAEANAIDRPAPGATPKRPWFEDASSLLGHRHQEESFDDFARQGLLPKKLSQLGPGLCWADVNGDGKDDLIIGSGKGGSLAILENMGKFVPAGATALVQRTPRDQTAVVAFRAAGAGTRILVGASNYEDGLSTGAAVYDYDYTSNRFQVGVSADASSTGPLAIADINGDGKIELFIGGRVIPGRYPEAADSRIMGFENGKWLLDATNTAALKSVGMVSAAVWTDLNRDGFPELVLACEWGPVRIFANTRGVLREATAAWKLDDKIGWWNGITAGDFDGDGRMDLIASNWGLNTRYRIHDRKGPRIYYGSWGGAGEVEPIEAVFDPAVRLWLPERDLKAVGASIPFIREKFQTHRAYAEAGIDKILGEKSKEARMLEVTSLETTVLLNRGDHFELGSLPLSAQFAPAFGVNVADFDGDGNEDIFLSQNFFAVHPQASRNDAGRGLLLRGDGHGKFERIDGTESGIKIYGEQRGSAVGDYDGDGRSDLAVTQNGAATILLHNAAAAVGLRVRLKSAGENEQGLGAIVRLGFKDGWGPAREIHGGSGYWSQDSATTVLAIPAPPEKIEILWPGGALFQGKCPAHARELVVDQVKNTLTVTR